MEIKKEASSKRGELIFLNKPTLATFSSREEILVKEKGKYVSQLKNVE